MGKLKWPKLDAVLVNINLCLGLGSLIDPSLNLGRLTGNKDNCVLSPAPVI